MATMDQLYQSVIIEHDRSPRNFRTIDAPTHHAEGRNPLCGDEVSLEFVVGEDGVITDAAFQGRGCAVSKASASMLTTAVKGKTLAEARTIAAEFQSLVTGKDADENTLGKLKVFGGLAAYPMRVKCATMPWHAMNEALKR
ncbi:MAG TPA: SUF system NifU family Fe-S cluster assembly protein [Gemmatimonadales bacterium]|nr:SUF system NifU family Fe-S cluster assembly protein [Gemmatimonadales bacterium]